MFRPAPAARPARGPSPTPASANITGRWVGNVLLEAALEPAQYPIVVEVEDHRESPEGSQEYDDRCRPQQAGESEEGQRLAHKKEQALATGRGSAIHDQILCPGFQKRTLLARPR